MSELNHIVGTSGNDILEGTKDGDLFIGGEGADTFVLDYKDFGNDMISDFENGIDLIDMSKTDLSFNDLTVSVVEGDTVIDDGMGNSIILLGVTSGIDQDDFIFG